MHCSIALENNGHWRPSLVPVSSVCYSIYVGSSVSSALVWRSKENGSVLMLMIVEGNSTPDSGQ